MRFAVIHCRNPRCLLKVWVPTKMLGARGRCPKCGQPLQAPAFVPEEELQEGPAILQLQEAEDRSPALASAL